MDTLIQIVARRILTANAEARGKKLGDELQQHLEAEAQKIIDLAREGYTRI